jgi:methylenetetrahydrofolate reductase (NADPH)
MKSQLKDLIKSNTFVHGIELVSTRGLLQIEGEKINRFAHEIMDSGLIEFISITDNPGGNPMLAPECIGMQFIEKGLAVNIHISCKDRNRNGLESRAWQLASQGFTNMLALTGDYPVSGYRGIARPIFDIDSVGLIKMLSDMNEGLDVSSSKTKAARLSKTEFFISAAVTPFKKYEAEYLPQFFKMEKKIRAGAHYFILQLGYDSRKWAELLTYARMNDIQTPFLANIYLLTKGVAKMFHDERIPGCVVSPELLELASKHAGSPDKGKSFFLEFAAKQWAIAKGLGFSGVYLGGISSREDLMKIREKADAFGADDWKAFYNEISFPVHDEFYLYRKGDDGSPLREYDEKYARSKKPFRRSFRILMCEPPGYRISRLVHLLLFAGKSPLFHAMTFFYRLIDGKKPLERVSHFFEGCVKSLMYGCHDCGDCSLPEIAYLCPEEKCSKNQRNGPCGGSRKGICEVDDKKCIWRRAYNRLKPHGEERKPFDDDIVIINAKLLNTSGWQNYYLKRDHTGKR